MRITLPEHGGLGVAQRSRSRLAAVLGLPRRRRLVAPATLDLLAEAMSDGAELRLSTDDRDYLAWMLEHTIAHPDFVWLARRPCDWRERPEDWPATRYEAKARAAGRTPAFLRFQRRRRG